MPSLLAVVCSLFVACAPLAALAQETETPREFGRANQAVSATVAYAPATGQVWGYTTNTRFSAVLLEYSVSLTHGPYTRLRYTPQLVPFASLEERAPSETNPNAPVRSYAAGARPVGLELSFARGRRIQPYASTSEGFLYYNRRVLSPGGSQFMFTLGFGGGVRVFRSARNAFSVGYQYQHQSNANISLHNPGTDGHTIHVGFSRFGRR